MTKKPASFEKSLERLEEIVSQMENADPDLDKALALFSEGVELVKLCSAKLNDTKKKIEILIDGKKENFND
ncbi:exodeoxyribonuclease VII small subunit [Endomicrobium proavitum]|uniref:Exodeoxyribonuclease 7 small subunit n=1 Tax=Endomicrobium proavitum TaxID=1408281 RepID=A0A0G3WGZ6_9BACT|nr:exodeoxyribonuclease VII small subunit [Endomicrobium proavitum]AKL97593.1 Exodeoxyribonuclease 7 small subunit [Endomicrobium proavitum]